MSEREQPAFRRRSKAAWQGAAGAACIVCCAAQAGVTTDGSLGPATTLAGPGFAIPATLGRQVGNNLFHSFSTFSLGAGEFAAFSGPTGIANILARVTGGTASSINGTLISQISGANLFLLNPAGISFGPSALLSVSGAFYASTGHYVRLADGGRFDTTTPTTSGLTTAAPSAFGFAGPAAGITVSGSRLSVPTGKAIGLVGGDIRIEESGASLAALTSRSGTIQLTAVSGVGEAAFGAGALPAGHAAATGNVTIRGNATLDANESAGNGGGSVFIRAGRIVVENGLISAETVTGNGRAIELVANGDIDLAGHRQHPTRFLPTLSTVTTGAGTAGAIRVDAANVAVRDTAYLDASADPGSTGRGGSITVNVAGALAIDGRTDNSLATGIVANTFGPGAGGSVVVSANRLTVSNYAAIQSASEAGGAGGAVRVTTGELALSGGGQISTATTVSGTGGRVDVQVSGAAAIDGGRSDAFGNRFPSGIISDTAGAGAGGSIDFSAGSLRVTGGGVVSSASRSQATGPGGVVAIRTTGTLEVAGSAAGGQASGIAASTFGTGAAGRLELSGGELLVNGGRIQSLSEGAGAGGEIRLAFASARFADGGQASTDARAGGAGGTIRATIDGTLQLSGPSAGLFANALAGGRSGDIRVAAGSVSIDRKATVSAFSLGSGRGGDIAIDAGRTALASGALVTAQSLGTGDAGNVVLNAGASLVLDAASIATSARVADGGNVTVTASDLVYLNGASITTSVQSGFGNGGNISIDPVSMVLNHATIIANAFGGNGGNITLVANNFLRSPDTVITASSQLGISGTIVIRSPITDLSGALVALSGSFLDTGALFANACAARLAGKASSLVLAGRGGLPAGPEAPLTVLASDIALPAAAFLAADPTIPRPVQASRAPLQLASLACTR